MKLDMRKVQVTGVSFGVSLVLVALVGMFEGLNGRTLIAPAVTLGYVMLVLFPLLAGYVAARKVVLEGMEAPDHGTVDFVTGAITGALTGAFGVVLIVLIDRFDIRDLMPNWSASLVDFLTFDQGVGVGTLILVIGGAVIGAFGGGFHTFPAKVRKIVSAIGQTVLVVAVLEPLVDDLLGGFGLDVVTDFLYEKQGGLSMLAAVVVGVVAGALAWRFSGRAAQLRTSFQQMDQPRQRKVSLITLAVMVVLTIVLPIFLGKIVNELLANVGLFILLALGLNIVVGLAGILDLGYVAFFAVGAYTMALLTSALSPRFAPEISFWAAVPVVVVVAAIVGLLIGTPVIRMRGDYLAIVTLGFGEIIRILFSV